MQSPQVLLYKASQEGLTLPPATPCSTAIADAAPDKTIHVEGGPFSRWHARHERWVAEVVDKLLNGEDPDEVLNDQDRDLLNETILGLCL